MKTPRTAELALPGVTASIPQARRFTTDTLVAWGFEQLVDAGALVVSELATNAVLHARSAFTVRLRIEADGQLRVEVVDASVRQPELRRHSQGATTGRGMAIVAELADDWGVDPEVVGKVVWVRLRSVESGRDRGAEPPVRDGRRAGTAHPRPDGTQVMAA